MSRPSSERLSTMRAAVERQQRLAGFAAEHALEAAIKHGPSNWRVRFRLEGAWEERHLARELKDTYNIARVAMGVHELANFHTIRHGGKEGWWQASCICGYHATRAVNLDAMKDLNAHIEAKADHDDV
jgi:hypothetical protein